MAKYPDEWYKWRPGAGVRCVDLEFVTLCFWDVVENGECNRYGYEEQSGLISGDIFKRTWPCPGGVGRPHIGPIDVQDFQAASRHQLAGRHPLFQSPTSRQLARPQLIGRQIGPTAGTVTPTTQTGTATPTTQTGTVTPTTGGAAVGAIPSASGSFYYTRNGRIYQRRIPVTYTYNWKGR